MLIYTYMRSTNFHYSLCAFKGTNKGSNIHKSGLKHTFCDPVVACVIIQTIYLR